MPIYYPERKVKVKCPKCGRVVTYKVGGYGDCIDNPIEIVRIFRDLCQSKKCPACGTKLNLGDLSEVKPS